MRSDVLPLRQKHIRMILVLSASVMLLTMTMTMFSMYLMALDEQEERLGSLVQSQARSIEAVSEFDYEQFKQAGKSAEEAWKATLNQFNNAFARFAEHERSDEFILAERQKDWVIFLLPYRHQLEPENFESGLAEPIKAALAGQSGTMIGLDYKGEKVLAAYESFVTPHGQFGLVAKVDLVDIQKPFFFTMLAAIALFGGLLYLIFLGFRRVFTPVIQAYEENAQILDRVYENTAAFIVVLDEQGQIVSFNKHAEKISGYLEEEVLGKNWFKTFVPKKEQQTIRKVHNDVFQEAGSHNDYINPILDKSGLSRLIQWRNNIYEKDGKKFVLSFGLDLTESKKLELKYQELYSNMQEGFVALDDQFQVVEANDAYCQMLGYGPEEIRQLSLSDLVSEESYRHEMEQTRELLKQNDATRFYESETVKKDGTVFPTEIQAYAIRDEQGELQGYWGLVRDITERKKYEQEIKQSEEKFRSIFNHAPLGMALVDPKGKPFLANAALAKMLGYSETELQAMSFPEFTHPEDAEKDMKQYQALIAQEISSYRMEKRYIRKDGAVFWADLTVSGLNNPDQTLKYALAMVVDIDEKKQALAKLDEQEKRMLIQSRYTAMEEVIGMLAHQWRQPIMVIAMGANNILADIELDNLRQENAKSHSLAILQQTDYLSKTIEDFRRFFQPFKEKTLIDMPKLLMDTAGMLEEEFKSHQIRLEMDLNEVPAINSYASALIQVYLNILKNAKEALLIHRSADKKVKISLEKSEENIEISICDNAGGVDESIKEKIFDPYFTTKGETSGTGLGLYASKTLIEKHFHGTISMENEKQGACFIILLPIAELK